MKLIKKYLMRISAKASRNNRRDFLALLDEDAGARILDVGCGDGLFSWQIAEKVGSKEIYGVELIPKYAAMALRNGVMIKLGDIDDGLPFEDGYFDIVVSNQVIEHVNNTDNFIKECHRVLKNKGRLIISTPNLASPHNIFALLLGYQPFSTAVSDEFACGNPLDPINNNLIKSYRRHRRVFTAPALRALLKFHGFEIEKIKIRYSHYQIIKARRGQEG